jgi:hypothetical protein
MEDGPLAQQAPLPPPPPAQAPIPVAADAPARVAAEPHDNPNQPYIMLDVSIAGPDWPAHGNWGNDGVARLFHVFAEAKLQKFVMGKDARASRAELQAGQTPRDKFWSVVHWLFNYGHVSDWFHPANEFSEVIGKVAGINPDAVGQKRDIKYLREKFTQTRKTVAQMVEAYKKSGQNVDATRPWADPAIEGFFEMSGGAGKRPNAGVFYAFLLSLKYEILQNLVEVCVGDEMRESGSVEIDGKVVGGAAAGGGFLDDTSSSTSSGSASKKRRGGGVQRSMEDMCTEMRRHLRMEREAPRVSFYENVTAMTALQKQVMTGASFVLTHEQALRVAGVDPETDPTLRLLKEELREVQEQVRELRQQMKEQDRQAKEAAAREYGAERQRGDRDGGDDSEGGEWDD